MKGRRYESIDTIKGISCIAVVLIHYLFPEPFAIPIKKCQDLGCRFFLPSLAISLQAKMGNVWKTAL